MNTKGLILCSRYSYPPNSYSLCGPLEKKNDMVCYTAGSVADRGSRDILARFETMYPYLRFIAGENRIKDEFDPRVVEAYWLGNNLLNKSSLRGLFTHLNDTLKLKKRLGNKEIYSLMSKLEFGAVPNHAFHVLNIWIRTGHLNIAHTLQTMEACLVGWGKVIEINNRSFQLETKSLQIQSGKLTFEKMIKRTVKTLGKTDVFAKKIRLGDWVSYHWGKFVQKLNKTQLYNLNFYTQKAINLVNINLKNHEDNFYIR